jgi:hypothetical protein
MKITMIAFSFIACLAVAAAEAQQGGAAAKAESAQVNPNLDSWLGCWRLEDDLAGTGARLCITPDKDGVRLQTVAGTVRGTDELLIPDGVARPIVDAECKGTERAEWSSDGQRVFRTTEVTCKNETARTIKGIAFLAPGPTLINVQHVSGEGTTAGVRVQRYRRAFNQNLADGSKAPQPKAAAVVADATWSIEDVIEASRQLPAEALQGALADVRQKFNINKKTLVAMDDAGVPDSVIDLMVALTFPQRFVVERATSSAPVGVTTGMGWYDPFMSPFLGSMYNSCHMAPGYYGYRSYYNMCGPYLYGYTFYPYGSYYYPYNQYGSGGWVVLDPNNPGGEVPTASGQGRVVNGRGYTQIRDRSPEPSIPRNIVRGDGSAAGWSGGGSSSGGGVSSSGYSSGSSSGGSSGGSSSSGGDRTAVARPPGGGL